MSQKLHHKFHESQKREQENARRREKQSETTSLYMIFSLAQTALPLSEIPARFQFSMAAAGGIALKLATSAMTFLGLTRPDDAEETAPAATPPPPAP